MKVLSASPCSIHVSKDITHTKCSPQESAAQNFFGNCIRAAAGGRAADHFCRLEGLRHLGSPGLKASGSVWGQMPVWPPRAHGVSQQPVQMPDKHVAAGMTKCTWSCVSDTPRAERTRHASLLQAEVFKMQSPERAGGTQLCTKHGDDDNKVCPQCLDASRSV